MLNELGRRVFLKGLVYAPLASHLAEHAGAVASPERDPGSSPTKSRLEPFNYSGVRLRDGMLKRQYLATRDLYYNLSDDSILKGFRERAGLPAPGQNLGGWYSGVPGGGWGWVKPWWGAGDIWNTFGQWVSALIRMAKATDDGALKEKAIHLMREWAKTIEPDGYFAFSRHPITPHWTYDAISSALLDMYEFGGEREAIPLLERITAWAVKNLDSAKIPRSPEQMSGGTSEGYFEVYAVPSGLLYRAYLLTGDLQYKSYGDVWRYDVYWNMFDGTVEPRPYYLHAYGHVRALSDVAMEYALTDDPRYLRILINAYDYLERTQLYATGGYGPNERLLPPDGSLGKSLETTDEHFETLCGTYAGFTLARFLIQYTGEARYGDWIEKLLYNASLAAPVPQPDGSNFYYSNYRLGGGRKLFHREWRWACCSGTYPEVVNEYHNLIYFHDARNLYVNLFVPSEVTWESNGNQIKVVQDTGYPEEESTTLTVRPQQAAKFSVRFRIPGWSQGASVEVNGKGFEASCQPGTWTTVERTWSSGDRVKLRIPMRLAFVPIDKQHPRRTALTYGPVVLVQEENPLLDVSPSEPSEAITPEGPPLEFRVTKQRRGKLMPFYQVGYGTPYNMYFDLQA